MIKIVIWDNIGNTLLGMRPWNAWPASVQDRLRAEEAVTRTRVVTIADLFPDYEIDLVWLFDPVKAQRGFHGLFGEFGARLVHTSEPDALERELADADFLIMHKETLPASALAQAHNIRLIQHLGLDHRGVPMEAARSRGIPVTATPLINYSAVAEHVWAMILTDLKRMFDQRHHMASHNYLTAWGAYHPGVQIVSDLTLGLVGLGEIARPVANIARAFNMRTIYWDIVRFPELEERLGVEYVKWEDLFRQSDVLSVQLALNDHTEGIIGAREFALMKPTALFVNTARGKLVDEEALADALDAREIRAAAIDAFNDEPLPTQSRLHALHDVHPQRVVLTPHSAAQGPWTWIRDSQELWFNVRRMLDGKPVKHLVS